MRRAHATASPLHRVEDRQSCLSGPGTGQAGLPVLHSLQRVFGNHTIAGAIRDGLAAPAQPLDFALRAEMERRLGHDFGNVRVHVDAGAAARVEARAFAFGDDIVLASHKDRGTLPHELTHVAQQRGRVLSVPTRLAQPHERAEQHADAAPAAEALHRTPASMTNCPGDTLTLGDKTKINQPVDLITKAETTANKWLDQVIAELTYTHGRIAGGAAVGWPTISDQLAKGLRLVRINPDDRDAWSGAETKAGTVAFVLKRLRDVRAILGAGTMSYTCRGDTVKKLGTCTSNFFCFGVNATTCKESLFIAFCDPFWKASEDGQARIVYHEHFHALSKAFNHEDRADNIYCYERLAQLMSNVPVEVQQTDKCGDL